jgi:hypothetical protein
MKRLAFFSSIAASLLCGATAVRADLTMEMKQNGEAQHVYLKEHMFAVTNHEGLTIFRGDKQVLWTVNTHEKTCAEMTKADAQAAGEQMNAARSQMREAMKNVPAEQRAMMEKMIAGHMPKPQADARVIKPSGETKTINGYACAGYLVTHDDGSVEEIWTADPAAVHIEARDLAVFAEFAAFIKSLMAGMGLDKMRDMIKDYAHPDPKDVPGFPILTVLKDADGKETWRAELVKLDHGAVAADKFEAPAGFQKTKMTAAGTGKRD